MTVVNLSLLAHTNVGKTTLMRTLLRRDVGEVADRAHVTDRAEGHVLVDTPEGDVLKLWDTPGLGDSARLMRRLEASGNPLGWFLTQVWDRFTDRPFHSSQLALRNARDESDLVVYMVNAAEDPVASGYTAIEMRILAWLAKPVVVLLNQTGPYRGRETEGQDEDAWRRHFASHPEVRGVLSLDAFARSWVHEDRLLALASRAVPAEKHEAFERLRAAWRKRNLQDFERAVELLAEELARAAADAEPIEDAEPMGRALHWARSMIEKDAPPDRATSAASAALAKRLSISARELTDRLISLHGLAGHAREEIARRIAASVDVKRPAEVAATGLLGGILGGMLTGLAADLSTGGLSLGAGALIGGVLGALGAGGAAHAYNVAQGDGRAAARWTGEALEALLASLLLRYLAVAHFGRGRGAWQDEEYPPAWMQLAAKAAGAQRARLERLRELARTGAEHAALETEGVAIVDAAAREVLGALYPDAFSREAAAAA